MAYEPYACSDYYRNTYKGSIVPEEELEKALRQASRHIDSLTYNRIVGRGFYNLTEFQQETVQEVVCQQADFERENAEKELKSLVKSRKISSFVLLMELFWN